MTRRAWLGVVVMGLLPSLAEAQQKIDQPAVEAVLKDALAEWKAPGLAVAIVHGDEVFVHGVGLRETGKPDLVTPDTIFAFASLTKAFTATGLGILIDDGKADWDDLVRKHLDGFKLHDPLADGDVRLRDLLCHRTGLARHDQLWAHAPWSLEETVRRMGHLEPTASFRSRYQYNNLAYIAAGLAMAKAAGVSWEEFTQRRLLTPLGMKNVVFTGAAARARPDHATPHRRGKDGVQKPIAWYPDEKQVRASGSLKGSVRDLVPWMRLHLNLGQHDGRRIVSQQNLIETHMPQIVVPVNRDLAALTETTQESYGLGWHIRDYRGWRMDDHGGANEGFRARLVLVPKAKLGVALLTNAEEMDMVEAASYRLVDQQLGLKPKGWVAYFKAKKTPAPAKVKQTTGTKPARELAGYAGTYRDRAYGDLVVKADKGLTLAWSSFTVPLEHFHYNTFAVKAGEGGRLNGELVTFTLDNEGGVAWVSLFGRRFQRVR